MSSFKPTALTLTLVLGICTWASRGAAQELKSEIVPDSASTAEQDAPAKSTNSAVSLEKNSAASVFHHHYRNDAERAQDDLLITEVKSALTEDGISDGYPVQVDADHGTVTLTGVVASAANVRTAGEDAANVRGVVAVKNQLRPH